MIGGGKAGHREGKAFHNLMLVLAFEGLARGDGKSGKLRDAR